VAEPLRIPLHGRSGIRGYALIDEEDRALVESYRWMLGSGGYARIVQRELVLMHRLILGLPPGRALQADHINHDKLDNRRRNLRVVTQQGNMQNRGTDHAARSEFVGVSWETRKQRWRARVVIGGQRPHLGYFATELDAAVAAERYRLAHSPFAQPQPLLAAALTARERVDLYGERLGHPTQVARPLRPRPGPGDEVPRDEHDGEEEHGDCPEEGAVVRVAAAPPVARSSVQIDRQGDEEHQQDRSDEKGHTARIGRTIQVLE
jgi:hypothetical protein